MKLVDRVLDNIASEEISNVASSHGLPVQNMNSIISAIIPGVLSAFKARLVSGMNSGNVTPLLTLLNNQNDPNNFDINALFDGNDAALSTLYNRVSELTGVSTETISSVVPNIMPSISNAVTGMLNEFGSSAAVAAGSQFINELLSSNSGYETAINSANQFLGAIFGGSSQEALANNPINKDETGDNGDSFVQNLIELFDQDNDGSVMDDIYRMLVR